MTELAAIVTDIEGTTTPIDFVHRRLFPYARERLAAFVAERGDEPAVRACLYAAAAEAGLTADDRDAIVAQLRRWIDEDRKLTPLKTLQGLIWEAGYRSGELTGPMYPDVAPALRRWQAAGLALYVYSSGSAQAQRLIFGYSDAGDLTPLFRDYFDTRVGHKREPAAYRAIAQRIGQPPASILFLSDVVAELDAAAAAGWQTRWVLRDEPPPADPPHPVIASFEDVPPCRSAPRARSGGKSIPDRG